MGWRVVVEDLFSLNSPIFVPSLAYRRKSKFVERKNHNFGALACLGVVRNFRNFFKSVFPTKRGEGVLAKYELEKV